MTRQINADQIMAGDVIAWCGRRSIVRRVKHEAKETKWGRRRSVRLDLDVPELAHEGKGAPVQQNGLHWRADELVILWDAERESPAIPGQAEGVLKGGEVSP